MKLITFNVNGIRSRLHQLNALLQSAQPDIVGLQEIKVRDEEFPLEDVLATGYQVAHFGQKGHYGVAILSKTPLLDVEYGLPGDDDQAQRRLISATCDTPTGSVRVINGYFPQGESRQHETKYPGKRAFFADVHRYLTDRHRDGEPVVLMGDFNVAPLDADIGIGPDNAKRWLRTGKCSFLPEEREWYQRFLDWGLEDSYRSLHPQKDDRFSWFDYRSRAFERDPKRGLRIDHILVTAPLAERVLEAGIDYETRSMERPSDHCPVWTTFNP